jgi:hypothetical protein
MGFFATTVSSGPTPLYRYLICGLVVQSEVVLASAIMAAGEHRAPDIIIRSGGLPARLESARHATEAWETQNGLFLFKRSEEAGATAWTIGLFVPSVRDFTIVLP